MSADAGGLMRVEIPAGSAGHLEVTFTRTPMRSVGLLASGATAVFGLVALAIASRKRPRVVAPAAASSEH